MAFLATVCGHLFGILALILLLAWLLHYRGGIELDSYQAERVFNVHPFLMYFGFIFLAGEAIMAYKVVRSNKKIQKLFHSSLHLMAIVLGIIGIYATFKYHNQKEIPNMYSLHSWIGLSTFIIYGLQWIFGFFTFWMQGGDSARMSYAPWHIFFGRILLYAAIVTAETGLMQAATLLQLKTSNESHLVNFTGLAILLFGIAVDLTIASVPMLFNLFLLLLPYNSLTHHTLFHSLFQ